MQAVAPRTLAAVFTGGQGGRQYLKLPPCSVHGHDLAREPGPLAVLGRALPRQREHGPPVKLVYRFPRRAGGVALGVLLEGLADAGEGDGGHRFLSATG